VSEEKRKAVLLYARPLSKCRFFCLTRTPLAVTIINMDFFAVTRLVRRAVPCLYDPPTYLPASLRRV
jgi:hypothetical protein